MMIMKKVVKHVLTILLITIIIVTALPQEAYAANVSASIPNGIYYIGTKAGNRLDIKDKDTNNGAIAQIWKKANNDNQAFIFMRLPDGTYKITAYHSGLSLEVSNSSKANSGKVQQWEFLNEYACKRWYIYDCGNGWYKIVNKNSGKCLDIKGGKDESGTIAQQYEDNGTDAQRFSLTRLEYSPQNYNRYETGDKIYVTGKYYASSDGNGNYGYLPQEYVIEKTVYGAKYPYAIRPVNSLSIYGWINEDSILIPDYTENIMKALIQEFQYLENVFAYSAVPDALYEFYDTFKTGGRLDLKNRDRWNEMFSFSHPGKEKFLFFDMVVTADQLGNIVYGLFGTLLGVNDVMLYWGGGFAHQKNITGKSFGDVLKLACLYNPNQYYGDTAEDHFDIMRGILLAGYQEEYLVVMRLKQEGKVIQIGGSIINVVETGKKIYDALLASINNLSI